VSRRRTHRGRHSRRNNAQYLVYRFVLNNAFHDRDRSERINTVTSAEIVKFITNHVEEVTVDLAAQFERGEVLVDSRGEGSLQRLTEAAADPDFFSHCAQKKKFSLNTFETSTGKAGNFEVNN